MNKPQYMNKDNKLSMVARQNLHITESQLYHEIVKRTQVYFHPDASDKLELSALKTFVCCAKCKQIPLDLQQCTVCEAIVCEPCQKMIQKEHEEQGLPRICPKCNDAETFDFKQVKQHNLKELIKLMTETHTCEVDRPGFTPDGDSDHAEESKEPQASSSGKPGSNVPTPGADPQNKAAVSKTYDIFGLAKHLDEECGKNRTCYECDKTFSTRKEFHTHLQFVCDFVKIECSDCNQKLIRREFKLHDCFIKKTQAHFDLASSVYDHNDQNESNQIVLQSKINELKDEYEGKINALQAQHQQKEEAASAKIGELRNEHDAFLKILQAGENKVGNVKFINCKQQIIERCNAGDDMCSKCNGKIKLNEYLNYCLGCEGVFHKGCDHPRYDEDFYNNFYALTQKECDAFRQKFEALIQEVQNQIN